MSLFNVLPRRLSGSSFQRRFRPSLEILEDRLAPAVFTVDIATDENDGNTAAGDLSLREAIGLANAAANTGGVADEIRFDAALNDVARLRHSLGELLITDSVKIIGNGPSNTIIEQDGADRVFHINNSSASFIDVEFQSLTVADGNVTGNGGGVLNLENLTIRDCRIAENNATLNGAGIYNESGNLTVVDSSIFENESGFNGGGVYNDSGNATLTNCVIRDNRTEAGGPGNGAGLYNQTGTMTIIDCTVSGNANGAGGGGNGGGFFNFTGTANILSSTFNNNTADNNGGAWQAFGGTVNVVNSTLSGNFAKNNGGAISNQAATTTVINTTITNNRADSDGAVPSGTGGGIRVLGGTVTLKNTIVAGNFVGASGTTADDISGSVTANFSFIGINTGATISGANNQVGSGTPINPLLGGLTDNSGPTETHALAEDSPAKNAGSNDLAEDHEGDPLTTDQRGFARIADTTVDIGAFEFGDEVASQSFYAVGADAGSTPRVRAFNADGTVRFDFLAFAESFRGGVRVATGDISGDGVLDIIAAAGPGAGPHVRVFDGITGLEIRSFYAFESTFQGGVFVASADVNNDGRDDIIAGADAGGGPRIVVRDGVTDAQVHSFYAFDPTFRGGVRVAAGDLNDDDRADIIAAAGPGGGPHVRSFDSTSLAQIDSFFAYNPFFAGGVYVAAGDFDNDGNADIVVGSGPGTGNEVKVFKSQTLAVLRSFNAYLPIFQVGARVAVFDQNGDTQADILTGPGSGGGPHVRILDGLTLAELDSFYAFEANFFNGIFVG